MIQKTHNLLQTILRPVGFLLWRWLMCILPYFKTVLPGGAGTASQRWTPTHWGQSCAAALPQQVGPLCLHDFCRGSGSQVTLSRYVKTTLPTNVVRRCYVAASHRPSPSAITHACICLITLHSMSPSMQACATLHWLVIEGLMHWYVWWWRNCHWVTTHQNNP